MKNIALWPNQKKDHDFAVSIRVAEILHQYGAELKVRSSDMPKAPQYVRQCETLDELLEGTELTVVIGGDGTILSAAKPCSKRDIPILGVNMGKVGYMSGVELGELELLKKLFEGDYSCEKRMMLDVSINGAEYSLADMVDMGDGTYRLYTSPLSATQLDDVFVVVAGGATLTYSANAYSYSMRNNEKMQDLAIALYRYGVSAEAFVSASVSEN